MTLAVSQRVDLAGEAGRLEAVVEVPQSEASPVAFAVVCHPHPQHGGTMNNKVVTTIARAAHLAGAACIRFNYRGVGASEGSYDEGHGEARDALTAIAHGRRTWPDAVLWLAGFSFGGCIALRCSTAHEAGAVDRLLTVAPALASHFGSPGEIVVPRCPWLVLQGQDDEVVDAKQAIEWAGALNPAPELLVLPGVGHYFHGALNELQDHASGFFTRGS
jgi:alpha/beta superfamily hydrolase